MSSELVHLALGAVVASALLGHAFDGRSLAVVLAATAVPDVDTFLGLWVSGGHRALLHTALLPLALATAVVWDLRLRDTSAIRSRWGRWGARTAAVAVFAMAVAGIGPDLFTNGVNVLYPLHDQFYKFTGEVKLSTRRGFVQTFVELQPPDPVGGDGGATGSGGGDGDSKSVLGTAVGSTNDTHYQTGVDPEKGAESGTVERTFVLVQSGMDLLLVGMGVMVTTARLWEVRVRDRLD